MPARLSMCCSALLSGDAAPSTASSAPAPARAPAVAEEPAYGVRELAAREKRPRLWRIRVGERRRERLEGVRAHRAIQRPGRREPRETRDRALERRDPAVGQRERPDG